MQTYLADTFMVAVNKLDNQSAKAAKLTAFELQHDPTGHGKRMHRIDKSRDKDFWSVRASRDIRIIIHKSGDRMTLCYVDHHDDAYDWAERRVFERHPRTGALQIVELVERVRDVAPEQSFETPDMFAEIEPPETSDRARKAKLEILPLADIGADRLLDYGVPVDWAELLVASSEPDIRSALDHLPGEAAEAVRLFLDGVEPPPPAPPEAVEAQRFRVLEHRDELEAALDYPWERWTVFLHPAQRRFAEASFSGPARVAGSAGTGKTVVALHRALRLSRTPDANVLLTTFSEPLAKNLARKLTILDGGRRDIVPRVKVASFLGLARELYELETGHKPRLVGREALLRRFANIAPDDNALFLTNEFEDVIDPWRVDSLDDYLGLSRTGRRSRIGRSRRETIWPYFETMRTQFAARWELTESQLFAAVEDIYNERTAKPFTHIVVDEAQDLGVPELRMLAAIAEHDGDRLFFAGDLGQRIFKLPFSWKALGIDVRGRSQTLRVNYRTSHQIRSQLDRLLPEELSDLDGLVEDRRRTISVFNGPEPEVHIFASPALELAGVAEWIGARLEEGISPDEIGIIVRSRAELPRARDAANACGAEVQINTMHLAKGLEFRCVAVIACDADIVPLEDRILSASTEGDLEEVWQTERQLLYVATTRAREHLWMSAVSPASEFLGDLGRA